MVLPALITGPLLINEYSSSAKIFGDVLEGKSAGFPPYHARPIDVRDVATAQIRALETAPFKRYALVERNFWIAEAGKWISEEFTQYGYKPTTKVLCPFTLWVGSFIDKDAKYFYKAAKVEMTINTDMTKKELKIDYIDAKQSFIDMCYSFIKHGVIEAKGDLKK